MKSFENKQVLKHQHIYWKNHDATFWVQNIVQQK